MGDGTDKGVDAATDFDNVLEAGIVALGIEIEIEGEAGSGTGVENVNLGERDGEVNYAGTLYGVDLPAEANSGKLVRGLEVVLM